MGAESALRGWEICVLGWFPAGAEAHLYFQLFVARLKRLRTKELESGIPPVVLQGLKPDVDLIGFIGTTEQAAEKLRVCGGNGEKHTSAAKATLIPLALYRG
jgi:hypothetical protein